MNDIAEKSTDSRLIAADKVEGTAVYDRQGEKLGTVKDIFIDKMSGKVEFASMAFGGLLGIGERYHPVPWSALDYDTHKDGFVVDMDKAVLEGSPSYDDARLASPQDEWGGEVNDYYSERMPSGGYGAREIL